MTAESLDRRRAAKKSCSSRARGKKGGRGATEFCRRPLSSPSGLKSPGDRKRRPSRGDRRFVKVLLQATLHRLRVQGPSDPQKTTRPSLRVINTSGNVLTNYLTCRFLPDSTMNSSGSPFRRSAEITRDRTTIVIKQLSIRLR